jgi:ABC-type transport system substrate-binding protein
LRIEMRAAVVSLDPAETPVDQAEAAAKERLAGQVFETLVQLDDKGEPQPWLATSWTHEQAHRRWVFAARKGVMLHNGVEWAPPGGIVAVDDNRPIEEILRNLAKPRNAIVVRAADGVLIGTGPFRIANWETKKVVTLEAHDRYWGGRPFLDRIEVRMGRSQRDQALDFELAKADVVELPLGEIRHTQQQGGKVSVTAPVEVVALVFENRKPEMDRLREALSLSIDRATIHKVLLQQQGSTSAALLPQWLSGYAFLFPAARDLTHAKELAGTAPPLSFAYDGQAPLVRSIAERIILNAGEAGLTLRAATGGSADVRMVTLRIASADARQALEDVAVALQAPFGSVAPGDPARLYEAERALLESRRVIPLFHLPEAWQLGANVRAWKVSDRWRLENVWLDQRNNQ